MNNKENDEWLKLFLQVERKIKIYRFLRTLLIILIIILILIFGMTSFEFNELKSIIWS